MKDLEKMKNLFQELGLEFREIKGDYFNFIDVLDTEGNKAEFAFYKDGSFATTGYHDK